MAVEEYVVFQAADQRWGVQHRGKPLALFPDKGQAIRAAVSIAHATANPENPAIVLSNGAEGQTCPIWTFGKDGFVSSAG